jgi:hypothetical protein
LKAYNLAFDRATVDGEITEVRKQFLGPVLALYQFEELGGIVDELLRGLRNGNAKITVLVTVVQVLPPMKTSWVKRRNKNGMFV